VLRVLYDGAAVELQRKRELVEQVWATHSCRASGVS
jgi:hypothetical protein